MEYCDCGELLTDGDSMCPACRQACDGFYEKLSEEDFDPKVDDDAHDADGGDEEDWLHADD